MFVNKQTKSVNVQQRNKWTNWCYKYKSCDTVMLHTDKIYINKYILHIQSMMKRVVLHHRPADTLHHFYKSHVVIL